MQTPYRVVSTVLLDFVYGEPLPPPEVVEDYSASAWQKWLDSIAGEEPGADFEDTRPSALH